MKFRKTSVAIFASLVSAIAGMVLTVSAAPSNQLKVGFITVGSLEDAGYNHSHNVARLYMENHIPHFETNIVENVPENAEAARVMERLVAQGDKLIFATSYGFLEPTEQVAKNHPDVTFMQTWRPSSLKNVGCYAIYQFEPLYAVGMIAGKMTKTNNIGFVCAHPVPVLLQDINSFTLGARSVNSKAKVHVVWTNSWADPPTEAEATKGLIESGNDVVGCVLDSPMTVVKVANQSKTMVFGTQWNAQPLAPDFWLGGSAFNWTHICEQIGKSVRDGTWKKETYWLGMKEEAAELCPFGKIVPASVGTEANKAAERIKNGSQIIFKGPLKDRDGKLRLKEGEVADAKMLAEMDWLVPGVEGALPKH